MVDSALVNYIKKELKAGSSLENIKRSLMEQDWSEADIQESLNVAQNEIHLESAVARDKPQKAVGPVSSGKSSRPIIGIVLSLVAGLLILTNLITELGGSYITDLQSTVVGIFASIGVVDFTLTILNVVLAVVIIAGAFMLHIEKHKVGGGIIIILSVLYFLINGFNIGFLLGVTGGIFGIIRR